MCVCMCICTRLFLCSYDKPPKDTSFTGCGGEGRGGEGRGGEKRTLLRLWPCHVRVGSKLQQEEKKKMETRQFLCMMFSKIRMRWKYIRERQATWVNRGETRDRERQRQRERERATYTIARKMWRVRGLVWVTVFENARS